MAAVGGSWGVRQVYHALVFGYYIHFDMFHAVEMVAKVSTVDVLKDIYPVMAPQFATIWAQFVIQDYFVLSCLEDILAFTPRTFLPSFKQILTDHANNLLIYFVLPFNLAMCVNFWVLYSIDPGYIDEFSVMFDYLDRYTNHVVHTHVIAIVLVEMCLTRRTYPSSLAMFYPYRKIAMTLTFYLAVIFGMKMFSPIWPYPYFRAMTSLEWTNFILGNLALLYTFYALGFCLNSLRWGKSKEESYHGSTKQPAEWKLTWWWSQLSRVVQVVQSR